MLNKLIDVSKSRSLELLKFLIKEDRFMTSYEIRTLFDKRNPKNSNEDLDRFVKEGVCIKEQRISIVGKGYKAKRNYTNFKINNNNPLVMKLKNEM